MIATYFSGLADGGNEPITWSAPAWGRMTSGSWRAVSPIIRLLTSVDAAPGASNTNALLDFGATKMENSPCLPVAAPYALRT
jgi:hypothetical protein